ncbi:MAG: prepilin peptidase [Capsulimonadaceae bacterium]
MLILKTDDLVCSAMLGAVLATAVVTDVARRKIYNWLTLPAMVAGVAVNVVFHGLRGLEAAAAGWLVGSLWFLLMFLKGATGAADVKLLQAVGTFVGPTLMGWVLLYTALAGGVMGIIYPLLRGGWPLLKHTVLNALLGWHVLSTIKSADSLKGMADNSKVGKIPSAPAIAAGAAIEWMIVHHVF